MKKNFLIYALNFSIIFIVSDSFAEEISEFQDSNMQQVNESDKTNSYKPSYPSYETRIKGQYFFPGRSVYENSFGGEIEGLVWLNNNFGFGLSLGYSKWKGDDVVTDRVFGGGAVAVGVDGSISQVPIMGNFEVRLPLNDKLSINLASGLGYVFVNSKFDYAGIEVNRFGNIVAIETGSIDMDDAFIARLSAAGHFALNDKLNLFAGVAYQENISGGELSVRGNKLGLDADLSSFNIFTGLGYKF